MNPTTVYKHLFNNSAASVKFFEENADAILAMDIMVPYADYQQMDGTLRDYVRVDFTGVSNKQLGYDGFEGELKRRSLLIPSMKLEEFTLDWDCMGRYHPNESELVIELIDRGSEWFAAAFRVCTVSFSNTEGESKFIVEFVTYLSADFANVTCTRINEVSDADLKKVTRGLLGQQCLDELKRRATAAVPSAVPVAVPSAVVPHSRWQLCLEAATELICEGQKPDTRMIKPLIDHAGVPLLTLFAREYPDLHPAIKARIDQMPIEPTMIKLRMIIGDDSIY